MTRACASVVEARGSFSRGFLDAGSSPFASAAASCGALLAARSASLRAILGRPPTRRGLLAAGGAGIGIKLRAQIVHRLFCLAPALLQGRMPPERRRPRRGAHPHPVLGDTIQARHAGSHQCGEAIHQQALQHCTVIDPEIRQRLGVHSHPAAQPFKRDMLITQPRNLAGAADPLHGGIQPKRQQNPRVRRRVTRSPVHCLDGRKQRRQIEPLDETPHQTHPVIVRQKPVQADRAPSRLHALGKSQPRQTPTHALRRRLLGQKIEQPILFTRCHQSTLDENQTWRF